MIREFRFYQESTHEWYVDLPEWDGPKSALEMVMGADTMLNILSQGEGEVRVLLSTSNFNGADSLVFLNETPEIGEGAAYLMLEYQGITLHLQVWLCDVTKFVFGEFPKIIWLAKVN